jgi:hypothetical protein
MSYGVLVALLAVACSTRVPVKPEPVTPEEVDEGHGTFSRDADASLTVADSVDGATEQAQTGLDDASAGAWTSESADPSTSSTFGTDSAGSSSHSEVPSNETSTSTSLPPLPTRQLTVPLPEADAKFAILVSVDGLAPRFLEQVINDGRAPNFVKLRSLAAWTHNARTDKTHTYTLPNHTCMLTGLPVQPVPGLESHRAHFYTANTDPAPDATLHQLRFPGHTYTPSMFDVAHDHGLTTAMFASKTKFALYSQSYNDAGEPDTVGADNGTRKIDRVTINTDPAAMVAELVLQLRTLPPHLTFVHLNQPDGAGHSLGWGSPEYLTAVSQMDALLGQILTAVEDSQMRNRTALIITSDHGGVDYNHLDAQNPLDYQIPFYVMAPGVEPGDIYASLEHRVPPDATYNPGYEELSQPIRNGDAGNLALDLLGLEPIPDSVIHSAGLLSDH